MFICIPLTTRSSSHTINTLSPSTPTITIVNFFLIKADLYDNLIGFVTKLDDTSTKGIETIEKYSRFGTLLKVHKSDISGYKITQNKKVFSLNLIGLTFVRYIKSNCIDSASSVSYKQKVKYWQILKSFQTL